MTDRHQVRPPGDAGLADVAPAVARRCADAWKRFQRNKLAMVGARLPRSC